MNKIEKDEEEVDEDGNVIAQGPRFNAKEVQNFGMPSTRAAPSMMMQNGHYPHTHPSQSLPPGVKPLNIRMTNIDLSSLPNNISLPDNMPGVRAPPPHQPAHNSHSSSSRTADSVPEAGL